MVSAIRIGAPTCSESRVRLQQPGVFAAMGGDGQHQIKSFAVIRRRNILAHANVCLYQRDKKEEHNTPYASIVSDGFYTRLGINLR